MLSFLPAPILGIITITLFSLNTLIIPFLVLVAALVMYITPIPRARKYLFRLVHDVIPLWWVSISDTIMALFFKIDWDIQGKGELNPDASYLLISNHQSWLDIIVLEKVFKQKVPMLKFFMKKELLWMLPIAGLACYVSGYPFMKRYSKEYLKKHPEKTGQDLEITRRACERLKNQPITIINYIEGTRFTKEKHRRQQSPYKHLLKPKAGGFSFIIAAMQGHLDDIINTTIIYPKEDTTLWDFMCGKVKKIIVRYEVIPVNENILGDYFNDAAYRHHFQQWTNQLWHEKDKLIDEIFKQEKIISNDQ